MISDRTIDEKSAKYWCAFADKDFKSAIDHILKDIASQKTQKVAQHIVSQSINQRKPMNEGFIEFMSKISPTDPAAGSTGIVADLAGKSKEEIKINADAMTAAAVGAAAVLTPAGKIALKHPLATTITAGATTLAADAAGDKDDTWLEKLGKLVNKVWDIGKFTAQHGKTIAIASTAAYALFKTANIWMPIIGSFIKSLLRGNSLATVDFESNGTWYRMRYDVKYKRWELVYKDFSMGATPPPEDINQLLDTKFFAKFLEQCKKYIQPIVENDERNAIVEAIAALSDKKTKNALQYVFSDTAVVENMFAMKFKY